MKQKTDFKDTSDKSIPIVPMPGISRHTFVTKEGNFLQFFYNQDTQLLVVDLVDKSERGGTELLRKILDSEKILNHLAR